LPLPRLRNGEIDEFERRCVALDVRQGFQEHRSQSQSSSWRQGLAVQALFSGSVRRARANRRFKVTRNNVNKTRLCLHEAIVYVVNSIDLTCRYARKSKARMATSRHGLPRNLSMPKATR